jgi:hypothetical protein
MSLFTEFSSPQSKCLVAYMSYQAVPHARNTLFQLDGHLTFDLDVDEHASPEEISRSAEAGLQYYERDTREWFVEVKARLEGPEAVS